jgi:hypothetical protein
MTYSAAFGRILALLLLALLLSVQGAVAAPAPPAVTGPSSANAPDWLSADSAAQLDLGFPVLVPDYVPGPFGGEPSITAYDGYYSLYWLVPGTPPTYLQITGEVGGSIPDFSYYDRNNQLFVNASVRGYDAYHDLTPVYDRVYWQEGDVVYTVDSLNLSDTDSLSLANSLSPLVVDSSGGNTDAGSSTDSGGGASTGDDNAPAPALSAPTTVQSGGTVSLDVSGVTDATLSADAGSFAGSGTDTLNDVGASTVSWQAPATDTDLSVLFILANPSNGDWLATANTTVTAAPAPDTGTTTTDTDPASTDSASISPPQSSAALACDPTVSAGGNAAITLTGSGNVRVDASSGGWPADPNGDFDAAADGGGQLNGALSGGPVNLVWTAPTDGSKRATIAVSDSDGTALATCAISIQADTVSTTSATTNATRESPRIPSFFGDGTGLGNIGVSGKGSGDGTSIDSALVQHASRDVQPGSGSGSGSGSGDKHERGDATGMGRTATESPKPTAQANRPAGSTSTPEPAPAASAAAGAATPTKRRTPAAAPTATLAPSSGPNGMVAKVIGPAGGTLESPAGAKLVIPPGALTEDATVTIVPVADSKLPVAEDVEFVPGSAFDVTVAAPTGNSIEKLEKPATLTVSLKPEQWRKGITLYWIDGTIPKALDSSELTESAVSADTNHFSRFAAGLPTTGESSKRDPVPFLLGALGVVVLLLAIVAFITAQHRRRPPSIPTRRNRVR